MSSLEDVHLAPNPKKTIRDGDPYRTDSIVETDRGVRSVDCERPRTVEKPSARVGEVRTIV